MMIHKPLSIYRAPFFILQLIVRTILLILVFIVAIIITLFIGILFTGSVLN